MPSEERTDKQNKVAIRYEKMVPEILSTLSRITGQACYTCKDKKKCVHWQSYKDWDKWWRKHRKDFKVKDSP